MYYNYCMKLIFVLSGHHILEAYVLQKKNNLNGSWYSVYVTIISKKNNTITTFLLPTPLHDPLSRAFINLLSTALHCHHLSLPIIDAFLCKFTIDWNKIREIKTHVYAKRQTLIYTTWPSFSLYTTTWEFLQFDWLRAVVFQLNLKYLHVKITNLVWVVV